MHRKLLIYLRTILMKNISKNKSHKIILKYRVLSADTIYIVIAVWSWDINDYSHGILIKCMAHINQVKTWISESISVWFWYSL